MKAHLGQKRRSVIFAPAPATTTARVRMLLMQEGSTMNLP